MLVADSAANTAKVGNASFGIDFFEVTKSHVEWRDRLKRYINGEAVEEYSVRDAVAYDRCGLGCWLRDAGRARFGKLTAFGRLEGAHAEFHCLAGLIIVKVREGNCDEADRLLRNEFSQAMRRILMEISEMNEVMQQTAERPELTYCTI